MQSDFLRFFVSCLFLNATPRVASQTVWVFVCALLVFLSFLMRFFVEMLAGPTLYRVSRKNMISKEIVVFKHQHKKTCKTIRRVVIFTSRREKKNEKSNCV